MIGIIAILGAIALPSFLQQKQISLITQPRPGSFHQMLMPTLNQSELNLDIGQATFLALITIIGRLITGDVLCKFDGLD